MKGGDKGKEASLKRGVIAVAKSSVRLREWHLVIPAEAGIQVFIPAQAGIYTSLIPVVTGKYWIPAYAGMTAGELDVLPHSDRIIDTCYKAKVGQ